MKLSQVIIVLCNPDESRNVGSVCRSMLTMDLSRLRIVGKKENYDENHVYTLALHAKAIWDQATFYDSLEAATEDCVIIAGTTRRRGKKRKRLLLPEEFASQVAKIPDSHDFHDGQLALVFGNERTGLTDEELDVCTMGVTIPTSETFGSLNLSHAVQIFAYELFRANAHNNDVKKLSSSYKPLTVKKLNETVEKILENLQSIGFFTQAGKEDMRHYWLNILTRSLLSQGEARYLEKIFSKAAGLSLRKKNDITSSDDGI